MPAVRTFSLYAALSLFLNFCLQVTAFVAFVSLDLKRQLSNRHDLFCCFKSSATKGHMDQDGPIQAFFNDVYVPSLLSKFGRPIVMILFLAWTCASVYLIPQMDIGLEQELAMPDDSFVLKYLTNLKTELSVGAPVYFVVNTSGNHILDGTCFHSSTCL